METALGFSKNKRSNQEAIAELIAAKNQLEQSLRSARIIAVKHGRKVYDGHSSEYVTQELNAAIAAYTEQEQANK